MSARASFDSPRADRGAAPRMGGVPLPALLAVCLNPLLALINQGVVYAMATWMCTTNHRWASFVVPAASLVLVGALTAGSYGARRRLTRTPDAGQRAGSFLALLGVLLGVLASLLIIAHWVAAWTFPPCARL